MPQDPHEQEVRRLLAEARHDGPMPDDVATRMDETLARLREERAIDELPRRRRRRTRAWVAAAAVVVVVGAGGTALVNQLGSVGGGDDAASSESVTDDSGGGVDTEPAPGAKEGPNGLTRSSRLDEAYAAHGAPTVSADTFAEDAARVAALSEGTGGQAGNGSEGFACAPAEWGPGTLQPVTYRGGPAVLALRPPEGDVRTADLLACGTADVLLSASIPAG